MLMEDIYRKIDSLGSLWKNLEELILQSQSGMKFKQEGCDLSFEKYGELMRICFRGKWICDCKAIEKIEAVDHIPQFFDIIRETREKLAGVTEAVEKIRGWIEKFESELEY